MDVLVLIDKLDDLVHNAKPVPLTDQVRVDKEEIYDILDQMRATIPEEIKQARWIVKERQEMLAEAKREAERIIKEARERQEHLVGEEEVTKQAERAAEDIVEDARAREREIRLGAEDYADEILNTLEVNLSKFIAAVQRGRERLQGKDEPAESLSTAVDRSRRHSSSARIPVSASPMLRLGLFQASYRALSSAFLGRVPRVKSEALYKLKVAGRWRAPACSSPCARTRRCARWGHCEVGAYAGRGIHRLGDPLSRSSGARGRARSADVQRGRQAHEHNGQGARSAGIREGDSLAIMCRNHRGFIGQRRRAASWG